MADAAPAGRSREPPTKLGVSIRAYREIEAGERSPDWETFDRICKTFGWPQTFVGA